MHSGYALLTKDLPFDEPSRDTRRRTHLDGPAPSGLQTEQAGTGDPDARDATDELRMEQGPRVRPD